MAMNMDAKQRVAAARAGAEAACNELIEIRGHIDSCLTCIMKTLPLGQQLAVMLVELYGFAATSASVLPLVDGATHLMAWAKVKLAAGIVAVATVLSGGVLLSDSSRFRVEVQSTSRFEHKSSGLTIAARGGATNLFVLTSQKAASGLGGGPVERL